MARKIQRKPQFSAFWERIVVLCLMLGALCAGCTSTSQLSEVSASGTAVSPAAHGNDFDTVMAKLGRTRQIPGERLAQKPRSSPATAQAASAGEIKSQLVASTTPAPAVPTGTTTGNISGPVVSSDSPGNSASSSDTNSAAVNTSESEPAQGSRAASVSSSIELAAASSKLPDLKVQNPGGGWLRWLVLLLSLFSLVIGIFALRLRGSVGGIAGKTAGLVQPLILGVISKFRKPAPATTPRSPSADSLMV